VILKWLGFWAVRRAFRVVLADDPRPFSRRLRNEAFRLALVTLALFGVVIVVVVYAFAQVF
jgi:hypothetical protein